MDCNQYKLHFKWIACKSKLLVLRDVLLLTAHGWSSWQCKCNVAHHAILKYTMLYCNISCYTVRYHAVIFLAAQCTCHTSDCKCHTACHVMCDTVLLTTNAITRHIAQHGIPCHIV